MAALPKRKGTSSRRNRRRSHDALKAPNPAICPKCKTIKRPHFKCPNCGFYGSSGAKTLAASGKKASSEAKTIKSTRKTSPKNETQNRS